MVSCFDSSEFSTTTIYLDVLGHDSLVIDKHAGRGGHPSLIGRPMVLVVPTITTLTSFIFIQHIFRQYCVFKVVF